MTTSTLDPQMQDTALVSTGKVLSGLAFQRNSRIDPDQEHALWADWMVAGTDNARLELIALYQPYAQALAAKCYARRIHNAFEFDEYLQFATVGMLEAMERFDPSHGAPFKSFATKRIVGAILDGLQTLSEQQQQVAWRRRIMEDRRQSLMEDAALDDGKRLLAELGAIGAGIALGFILEGTGMIQDETTCLPDNAYGNTETKQLHQHMWRLVEGLPAREAKLIKLHYQQQQTFDEVAKALQITKGRVSQLHKQILLHLRNKIAPAPPA